MVSLPKASSQTAAPAPVRTIAAVGARRYGLYSSRTGRAARALRTVMRPLHRPHGAAPVAEGPTIGKNPHMDLGYWSRVGTTLVAHPLEMIERLRQRAEMWWYARDDSFDHRPDPDWE